MELAELQTPVAAEAAELLAVQLVVQVDQELPLFGMQMFRQLLRSRLQLQSLQVSHTHSALPRLPAVQYRAISRISGVKMESIFLAQLQARTH